MASRLLGGASLRQMDVGGGAFAFKLFATERKVHDCILIKSLCFPIKKTFSPREAIHLARVSIILSSPVTDLRSLNTRPLENEEDLTTHFTH